MEDENKLVRMGQFITEVAEKNRGKTYLFLRDRSFMLRCVVILSFPKCNPPIMTCTENKCYDPFGFRVWHAVKPARSFGQ